MPMLFCVYLKSILVLLSYFKISLRIISCICPQNCFMKVYIFTEERHMVSANSLNEQEA